MKGLNMYFIKFGLAVRSFSLGQPLKSPSKVKMKGIQQQLNRKHDASNITFLTKLNFVSLISFLYRITIEDTFNNNRLFGISQSIYYLELCTQVKCNSIYTKKFCLGRFVVTYYFHKKHCISNYDLMYITYMKFRPYEAYK